MESGQNEDSKSSSEEVDQLEQANDDLGTGRSYECVFCKRGFTTAQALGGHMNIHRKDRAKTTRPSSNSAVPNKYQEDYASPRLHPPFASHVPPYSIAFESQIINYQTYLSASTSGLRPPPHAYNINGSIIHKPENLNPFMEEWRTSLSLHIVPAHVEDTNKKKQDSGEEDELDLELRLGHDP